MRRWTSLLRRRSCPSQELSSGKFWFSGLDALGIGNSKVFETSYEIIVVKGGVVIVMDVKLKMFLPSLQDD